MARTKSVPKKNKKEESVPRSVLVPSYETDLGAMYQSRCEDFLRRPTNRKTLGPAQMVFTSPPFPLGRKKKYGNVARDEYVEWLSSYSTMLVDWLAPDGSIVLELGNVWDTGLPTMSTLPMKALIAFQERANLYLCQEFICYNPARLPTPIQWVARKRVRVKDAFTRVWWMSPTPHPKADNRRVLTKYSSSMRKLLEKGTYNPGLRPSEHLIGTTSFLTNNGGAIPPNVLVAPRATDENLEMFEVLPISNTRADDDYQLHVRQHGLDVHPARMPARLVEFFVEFLTSPGDLVLDPFAGSNTTGSVAEALDRRWLSIEENPTYIEGSRARFKLAASKTSVESQLSELRSDPLGSLQIPQA